MNVIFLRHGEKSMTPFEDPSLTPRGFHQAEDLTRLILEKKLPKPTHLISSPKARAQNTLKHCADHFAIVLKTSEDWTEQYSNESLSEFIKRVSLGIDKLIEQHPEQVVYICSHMDVLHLLGDLIETKSILPNEYFTFPTGGFLQFSVSRSSPTENPCWSLQNKGQLKG